MENLRNKVRKKELILLYKTAKEQIPDAYDGESDALWNTD